MGTSNFARGNASKVFAFAMREEDTCPECGSEDFEQVNVTDEGDEYMCCKCLKTFDTPDSHDPEMEHDDTRDNVFHHLKRLCEEKGLEFHEDNDTDTHRSYSGMNICEICKIKYCDNVDFNVRIIAKSVSAYYDGATLDWDMDYCIGDNCDEMPDENDIVERLIYYGDSLNHGLAKVHARHLSKWLEKTKDELIQMVESVFEQYTTPLHCMGTFSNGESVYQLANKDETV